MKVLFSYEAEQDDELSLNVGDIIKKVVMSEGGWWEGEKNGQKGLFPDNFVEVCQRMVLFFSFRGLKDQHNLISSKCFILISLSQYAR